MSQVGASSQVGSTSCLGMIIKSAVLFLWFFENQNIFNLAFDV